MEDVGNTGWVEMAPNEWSDRAKGMKWMVGLKSIYLNGREGTERMIRPMVSLEWMGKGMPLGVRAAGLRPA
jgi:hypothetical protein